MSEIEKIIYEQTDKRLKEMENKDYIFPEKLKKLTFL